MDGELGLTDFEGTAAAGGGGDFFVEGGGFGLELGGPAAMGGEVGLAGGMAFAQGGDFAAAAEEAGFAPADAAAGDAAAGVYELAVEGDDFDSEGGGAGDFEGGVDVGGDDGTGEEVFDDRPEARFAFDEAGGEAERALGVGGGGFGVFGTRRPDGVEGQEGGSAEVVVFEVFDGGFGGVVVFDDDVLEGAAEGGFDGDDVGFADVEDFGDGAVDALAPGFVAFEDAFGAAAEAFVFFLHVAEDFDARGELAEFAADAGFGGGVLGEAGVELAFALRQVGGGGVGGGKVLVEGLFFPLDAAQGLAAFLVLAGKAFAFFEELGFAGFLGFLVAFEGA